MTESAPNFPLFECAVAALEILETTPGSHVHQKFTCGSCGARQTMDVPDTFFKRGICESCGFETDIQIAGCNYLVVMEAVP